MNWDDLDLPEPDEDDKPGPNDDPLVQELEPLLLKMFEEKPTAVFYEG
jgi:hypothetical protein